MDMFAATEVRVLGALGMEEQVLKRNEARFWAGVDGQILEVISGEVGLPLGETVYAPSRVVLSVPDGMIVGLGQTSIVRLHSKNSRPLLINNNCPLEYITPITFPVFRDLFFKPYADLYQAECEPTDPPHDLDWALYERLAEQGFLLLMGVYVKGIPCGFFCGLLSPDMHRKTQTVLTSDLLYIVPEQRHLAAQLLRQVEELAKSLGAHRIQLISKLSHGLTVLTNRRGYTDTEIVATKTL